MKLSRLVPIILVVTDSALACQSMEDGAEIIKGEVKFIKNCHATEIHEGKEVYNGLRFKLGLPIPQPVVPPSIELPVSEIKEPKNEIINGPPTGSNV